MGHGSGRQQGGIEQLGWISLLRDVPFSQNEMVEYVMDVINRVLPCCNNKTVVLTIGIGSWMICEAICPYVNQYIGIDVLVKTLSLKEERLQKRVLKM